MSKELEESYDAFPRIEAGFHAALDESLEPRGPEMLFDLVADLGLPKGAVAVDVGCGEGRQALLLAERFGFAVRGFDPVARHVELSEAALVEAARRQPDLDGRVRFEVGVAEAIPLDDAGVDLVWCKDVLVHVTDLDQAYREVCRVLRPGGRALVFQSCFTTGRLAPAELAWEQRALVVVPGSTDPARTDAAISAAGLHLDARHEVGVEWGEAAEERTGTGGRRLLHAARLMREPERYVARFGQAAYDIMLADCLWHVDHMLGRLSARADLLSRPEPPR